ncbi:cache domain-containing protein [Helicobacter mesocricetorum]|uniref:cache domain-containing protein n=1 Tax=Helicobacter mesocricetorum TaxID=87012 RepID=UPI000CF11622|nr:cache domain-containing protein [Helicobacter mesocricetorum]
MEQSTIGVLSTYMPMAQRYKSQFISLNTLLSKTTLTGKISSLDIAENLFDYMEKTQEKFESLQDKLIHTIIEQSFLNGYEEAQVSVKIIGDRIVSVLEACYKSISILGRSSHAIHLYKEFYSKCNTNKDEALEKLEELRGYLSAFKESYLVYKDVLLFDTQGKVVFSLSENVASTTKMSAILEADGIALCQDFYQKVDFYGEDLEYQNNEYFFVVPMREDKDQKSFATIVLVVKLDDIFKEVVSLFPYRLPQANIFVVDSKNHILYSDNSKLFAEGQVVTFNVNKDFTFMSVRSKLCLTASQSLSVVESHKSVASEWRIYRVVPLSVVFDVKSRSKRDIEAYLLEDSLLITGDLSNVIIEAENINEDLGDVVINGEIIASKSHSYALNPILNNIRTLSEEMNALCITSTEELQKGIYYTLFNVVGYYSQYFVSIMDVLLSNCIKDIHWIENLVGFRKFLEEPNAGNEVDMIALLERLGNNFQSYYNILFFNERGEIIKNSRKQDDINGQKVAIAEKVSQVSIYKNGVLISNYEKSNFYNNKETFIFYIPILKENRVIGGLAFVWESDILATILKSSLLQDLSIISEKSEIFTVLFDSSGTIYATTKDDFSFENFFEKQMEFKSLKSTKEIIKIGNKFYLMSLETANGFHTIPQRKSLYCAIFVAIKEDSEIQ